MTSHDVIDYDNVHEWERSLRQALSSCVTDRVVDSIARSEFDFVEGARDLLLKIAGRDAVIDSTLTWIRRSRIAMYHGTRLTKKEAAAIHTAGLFPLEADTRRSRLCRALSSHHNWSVAQKKLDEVIKQLGPGNDSGRREGQVHFTLSKAGLISGFNHYLTHGSEFDQRAAFRLLGDEGTALLASDGTATLIQAVIGGDRALDACHRYLSIEEKRQRGEVPHLVDELLEVWSFRLAHPTFDARTLKTDFGFVFKEKVPPDCIGRIEELPDPT